MENINEAQLEMSNNHAHGVTGVLVSGFVWLMSSLIAYFVTPVHAVWTLLIGGAFIHPVSTIINKMVNAGGSQNKNGALTKLAKEGTVFMLMCIPLAYGLSLQRIEWFFQGMLMIIGGRYLTFHTIFGNWLFWMLGAVLGIAGCILFYSGTSAYTSALTGSIIEIIFAFLLYRQLRSRSLQNAATQN